MNVKELIAKLTELDQDMEIKIEDPYSVAIHSYLTEDILGVDFDNMNNCYTISNNHW